MERSETAEMHDKVVDGQQELMTSGDDDIANELVRLIRSVDNMAIKSVLTVVVDVVMENKRKVQFLQSEVRRITEAMSAMQAHPANIKDGHNKPVYGG